MLPRQEVVMRYWVGSVCALLLGSMFLVGCGGSEGSQPKREGLPSIQTEDVVFELEHQTVDSLHAVYVLGDLAALGGGDITKAVKLASDDGTMWRATVALPINRTFMFRYYERQYQLPLDSENGEPIGEPMTAQTSEAMLLPEGKVLYARSALEAPVLHWRQDDGSYEPLSMNDLGEGRTGDERLWAAGPFGTSGKPVELYVASGDASERDPPGTETYQSGLEAMFLQDGALFTYVPGPTVSPLRRDYELTDAWSSTTFFSEIREHEYDYRVLLPRGYDEHTDRRYPVVYFQDGDAVWDGYQGDVSDENGELTAQLVADGILGEAIFVGVTGTAPPEDRCAFLERRNSDYLPPGSTVRATAECPAVEGEGDEYIRFLSEELKPFIDDRYRTLTDATHTFNTGFSFGAIAALYMGWNNDETFSRLGVQSVGTAGNVPFLDSLGEGPRPDAAFYLDSSGVELGVFEKAIDIRDTLMLREDGFVLERDLRYIAGESLGHSWQAAGVRWEPLMTFLYPATDDAPECYDGIDNDEDGLIDFIPNTPGNDPDCESPFGPSEGSP